MLNIASIVRDTYARMGASIAEYSPFFGQWRANSQYGHPLAWCSTQAEAVAAVETYYATRLHLLTQ
jgi:hypothetical protein